MSLHAVDSRDTVPELHITVRPEQWPQARDALMYWQVAQQPPGEVWTMDLPLADALYALSIEGIYDAQVVTVERESESA